MTLALVLAALFAPDLTRLDPASARALDAPPVALVADGAAPLPVVSDGTAANRWAADYLAETIGEITGVRPARRDGAKRGADAPALYVGSAFRPDAAPADHPEAFRVLTDGARVFFLGRADYAVFDWVERMLDVRFYWSAAKGGRSVPKARELSVAAVDYADRPVFDYRANWPYDAEPWCRTAKVGSSHRGTLNVHAPHRWRDDPSVPRSLFATTNTPMLCYGNPETLAYYARRIDRHIAGLEDSGGIVNTNARIITVSQWDAPYACRCAWCRTLWDFRHGRQSEASPVLWGWFLKRLARWAKARHPDYRICFLPYWNTCAVPNGLDLRDEGNCEAMVCMMPGLAALRDEGFRRTEEGFLRDWARVTGRPVLSWNYSCWPAEYTVAPYLYGHTAQEHYARMRGTVAGVFINGGAVLERHALSLYVWTRCLWNPDLDVGAVYDAFARRLFGDAAPEVRRLLDIQERAWDLKTGLHPPEAVEEMGGLLQNAARKLAPRPPPAFRFYAKGFDGILLLGGQK